MTEKDKMLKAQESLCKFNSDFEVIVEDMTKSLIQIHETLSNVVFNLEKYKKDAFYSLKDAKAQEREKI